MARRVILILLLCGLMVGCTHRQSPKPYGYYRITVPDTAYRCMSTVAAAYPYDFGLSVNAQLRAHEKEGEQYWIDIHYPQLNADIHCSYKPVRGNLRQLTDDAIEFVYKHASHATAIPEHAFDNDAARVHGVFFELSGNTASPYQFFLTDSTTHFFRGAVYCNCRPNADSLAPVFDYLREDIVHLMETFVWK